MCLLVWRIEEERKKWAEARKREMEYKTRAAAVAAAIAAKKHHH